ncbi:hypothetical protein Mag101_12390 [Microbulbifer agarilyticus]|uniref:Radical SAM core domain-containing protein n=1 Tax=Microbulbifer agarilyticus TaxID=260552 RepID=A0A1Q2M6H4_9GAMM|nr:radical SAM protein [Microbulbifer agarilyticus]AQQ68345.1 hypothetical protein Mag101_12390 [Microbulbifer agarilyticus]
MKVSIVDLNNFSRYPTLSIGYFVAILRKEGIDVEVCSPLNFGVHGYPRTVKQPYWKRFSEFLNYWMAVSRASLVRRIRDTIKNWYRPGGNSDQIRITEAVEALIADTPDVLLISAYTMYHDICKNIGHLCSKKGIPVVVGGSGFYIAETCREWLETCGITAVYSGEPEQHFIELISALAKEGDFENIPGVITRNKPFNTAQPLTQLDSPPFPDFSDFPWKNYPNKIIPIMTGRGCEWGLCTFCSDVKTTSGRTFRSRDLTPVLSEIQTQQQRYQANLFVFLDLKLNSNVTLWRGLASGLSKLEKPIKWTASVHVDSRNENGLSFHDLKKASDSGLVRITCGLESGSESVLRHMAKGVKLSRMSKFIEDAHRAEISVRITCMIGYPNETAKDVLETVNFLRKHRNQIERVTLNRFANMPKTPIESKLREAEKEYPHIAVKELDISNGIIPYENRRMSSTAFLGAAYQLISEVNTINRKPLLEKAKEFEGAF